MPTLQRFSPPAFQNLKDFQGQPPQLQEQFLELWNTNLTGWTYQAMPSAPSYYYNPLVTDIPAGTAAVLVDWVGFPNRLSQYLGKDQYPPDPYGYSMEQLYELADTGYLSQGGASFPGIPTVTCPQIDWSSESKPYGPYGPRGWLDEYCEWSVVRNTAGSITRIDFCCENPEYWHSLWMVDPQLVCDLYMQALNFQVPAGEEIVVTIEDLQLVNPTTKEPVIDPSTGRPAYNGLNKWNTGPITDRSTPGSFTGGAMHLTSTPNTLQTEMGLAGAATVQRTIGNFDTQALICCSQYGQVYRHSDPHIGQIVNIVVSGQQLVSLADPVGLYIQMPQFDAFAYQLPNDPKLPPGAKVSDCWQIIRGSETLIDPVTGSQYPGNFILHAVFQIPQAWRDAGVSFTIGDITIAGQPIKWAGQVANTLHVGLYARPIAAPTPAPVNPCLSSNVPASTQPLQMFPRDIWEADYNTPVPNPVNVPMSLASNSTMIAAIVEQGATGLAFALTYTPGSNAPGLPTVRVPEGDITFTSQSVTQASYAVPGNSYPSPCNVVYCIADVAPGAQLGLRSLQVADPGGDFSAPMPALLNVVPSGTIGAATSPSTINA